MYAEQLLPAFHRVRVDLEGPTNRTSETLPEFCPRVVRRRCSICHLRSARLLGNSLNDAFVHWWHMAHQFPPPFVPDQEMNVPSMIQSSLQAYLAPQT